MIIAQYHFEINYQVLLLLRSLLMSLQTNVWLVVKINDAGSTEDVEGERRV